MDIVGLVCAIVGDVVPVWSFKDAFSEGSFTATKGDFEFSTVI